MTHRLALSHKGVAAAIETGTLVGIWTDRIKAAFEILVLTVARSAEVRLLYLGRDQRDEPRVDYVGHVDEGQARAPGSAVRAGAGDSRHGVRARRRQSGRVPDAEW